MILLEYLWNSLPWCPVQNTKHALTLLTHRISKNAWGLNKLIFRKIVEKGQKSPLNHMKNETLFCFFGLSFNIGDPLGFQVYKVIEVLILHSKSIRYWLPTEEKLLYFGDQTSILLSIPVDTGNPLVISLKCWSFFLSASPSWCWRALNSTSWRLIYCCECLKMLLFRLCVLLRLWFFENISDLSSR